MSSTKTRISGVAALTLGFLATHLVAAAIAYGGTYDVYACEAAPAPTRANNSWGGVGTYPGYTSICTNATGLNPTARGLVTRMVPGEGGKPSSFPNGAWSGLWFQAPPGTTIAGIVWSGRVSVSNWSQWRAGLQGSTGHYLVGGDRCGGVCWVPDVPATPAWLPAAPGTTYLQQVVQCRVAGCTTGAAMNTHWAQVRLSDNVAPGAAIAGFGAEQWVNSGINVAATGGENAGGGIRQVYVRVDNGPARSSSAVNTGCDYTRTVPCPPSRTATLPTGDMAEGRRKVDVVAVDAGGNPGIATRYLRVDKTRPRQIAPAVDGGQGWRRRNGYSARWTPVADGGAPIVGGSYELCRPGRTSCLPPRALMSTSKLEGLELPGEGSWELRVALRDEAGNQADLADAPVALLRLDSQAPDVRLAKQDASDPLLVEARVSDSLSGVAAGQIELRRRGTQTWQELETKLRGGALEAYIDDERHPDGAYDLRASAVDVAGNQSATGVQTGARSLPVRIKTILRAGMARAARKRAGKRRRIKLRPSRRVRYGRKYQVRGRLVTRDGQPLEDTAVNVYAQADRLGAASRLVGRVRTNRDGRFLYRAKARQSQIMRLRYEGTRRVRSAEDRVRLKVPARVSVAVRPRAVLNGEYANFGGRVKGPIPPGGKLVALQAYTGGRWGTFETARTNMQGRYQVLRRFTGTRGSVRYRIRAVATREPLFPYHSGASKPIRLRVRGL